MTHTSRQRCLSDYPFVRLTHHPHYNYNLQQQAGCSDDPMQAGRQAVTVIHLVVCGGACAVVVDHS